MRHIMEAKGWVLEQTEVRIPNGPLFTRAARYVRAGSSATLLHTNSSAPLDATTWFFNYFRLRYQVAATLPSTFGQQGDELTPDQHILIGANLDALAKHWADLNGGYISHQERMAEFLSQHGGHPCFDRVSGPFLLRYAINKQKDKRKKDPSHSSPWIDPIQKASRVESTGAEFLSWSHDRTLRDVLADPAIIAAQTPAGWLRSHRYGGMLYQGHRCSWIHESAEGLITDRAISTLWDEPHYESHNDRRILVFPGSFLLRTLAHAIASFEVSCRNNQQVPAP